MYSVLDVTFLAVDTDESLVAVTSSFHSVTSLEMGETRKWEVVHSSKDHLSCSSYSTESNSAQLLSSDMIGRIPIVPSWLQYLSISTTRSKCWRIHEKPPSYNRWKYYL